MALETFDRFEEEIAFLIRARDAFPTALVASSRVKSPDDTALFMVADIYERLKNAYMAMRRPAPDSWSRLEKIAALSTLAVMIVHPYETEHDDPAGFRINPLFALRCGFDRIGARFADLHSATVDRMLGWLDGVRIQSALPALDVVYASRMEGFALEPADGTFNLLAREVFDIDMLVSFYDVLKRYTDRLRPDRAIGG